VDVLRDGGGDRQGGSLVVCGVGGACVSVERDSASQSTRYQCVWSKLKDTMKRARYAAETNQLHLRTKADTAVPVLLAIVGDSGSLRYGAAQKWM
jgi:hypothetical protein